MNISFNKKCATVIEDDFDSNYLHIYILQRNRVDGTRVNQIKYRGKEEEEIIFDLNEDGYYTLGKLKISYNPADKYYYKDGKFFNTIYEVPLQNIIDHSEVQYTEYFKTCNLKSCYIKACQEIFNTQASVKCDTKLDQQATYKRDLLWMTINVIEYLTELKQFSEAERLLNRVSSCNGLCEGTSKDCGCDSMWL